MSCIKTQSVPSHPAREASAQEVTERAAAGDSPRVCADSNGRALEDAWPEKATSELGFKVHTGVPQILRGRSRGQTVQTEMPKMPKTGRGKI